MDGLEDSKHSYFLDLPDLVVRRLLNKLDLPSALALRLTSRQTKEWISQSNFLTSFKVSIQSEEDLQHFILNSNERWKNFYFATDVFSECASTSLDLFFETICDTVTILDFACFYWTLQNINLIALCNKLSCLTITNLQISDESNTYFPDLNKLKKLSLKLICFSNPSKLILFSTILKSCPNLEFFVIPRPQGPPDVTWTQTKELQWIYIIQSLIEHLSSFITNKNCAGKRRIQIVDISNVFARHFGPLAVKCVESKTLLLNVSDKQVKYVFNEQDEFLSGILSISEKIDDRRPLGKWTNLEEMHIRTCRCDIRNYYEGIEVFPKLKRLSIDFDSRERVDPGFVALNRVICLLIKTKRKSVEELKLKWPEFGHDTPKNIIGLQDIVEKFPNLKKLSLVGWNLINEEDEMFLKHHFYNLQLFCT